jgi:hypothetical protein
LALLLLILLGAVRILVPECPDYADAEPLIQVTGILGTGVLMAFSLNVESMLWNVFIL